MMVSQLPVAVSNATCAWDGQSLCWRPERLDVGGFVKRERGRERGYRQEIVRRASRGAGWSYMSANMHAGSAARGHVTLMPRPCAWPGHRQFARACRASVGGSTSFLTR